MRKAKSQIPLSSERLNDLQRLQASLGLSFHNLELLHLAFVHRSYANEEFGESSKDNERLEFLGDSVLGLVTAEYLFHRQPEGKEGKLAKQKSQLVSAPILAKFSQKFHFFEYLLLGKGGRGLEVTNQNIQADCFEAFLGAVFLDQGLASCRKLLLPLLTEAFHKLSDNEETKDYKTILQEFCQKKWKKIPEYITIQEVGPDHEKEFTVSVHLASYFTSEGKGKNKRSAEQKAAKSALRTLKKL